LKKIKILSNSPRQTMRIAKRVAAHLEKSDIIGLFGELGSGKTVFTKGLARGLGIKKAEVKSPSFILIRAYCGGRLCLYHFDLYRLEGPAEISALGYEEYFFAEGACVIEWADRLRFLLPAEYLKVKIEIRGRQKRALIFSGRGERYQRLISKLR